MRISKKILILTGNSSTAEPIKEAFEEKDIDVRYSNLTDLYIQYSSDTKVGIVLDVSLPVSWTLENFDLVVFRNLGDCREIAYAVATILRKSAFVKYIDCGIRSGPVGKISCGIAMWEAGLPVPTTQIVPKSYIRRFMRLQGTFPFIIKPSNSSRGRGNHLITEPTQNLQHMGDATHYLVQPFIPNDGDYRAYVMGDKVVKTILRQAKEGSHLNNISQGGTATRVDLPEELQEIAVKASKLLEADVAGVDVITNKYTGKSYILEVNRGPQLVSDSNDTEALNDTVRDYRDYILAELVKAKPPLKAEFTPTPKREIVPWGNYITRESIFADVIPT